MNEYHITYVRDCDRARVVFVIDAETQTVAEIAAAHRAPRGFRPAAACRYAGGPIHIPMDGDDYGREAPSIPANWSPAQPERGVLAG